MQTTNTVLMIRPARFAFNPDTAFNNRFQQPFLAPEQAQQKALEEFDGYVDTLRQHGVEVLVVQDTPAPHTPGLDLPQQLVEQPRGRQPGAVSDGRPETVAWSATKAYCAFWKSALQLTPPST